jgi:DNA recombination protein RmuC
LKDVKSQIKNIASKEYIDQAQGTVDFVLIFIPNDQVFGFIHLNAPEIYDYSLENKVVLCSPWTLYPILSIIRLAVDNFILEKNTKSLVELLRDFDKQWGSFNDCLKKMGNSLENTQKEFDQLVGVRQRKLGKVLNDLENLRLQTDFHSTDKNTLITGRSDSKP